MADIIQVRRDLAANWTSANPTLAQGEIGLETDTIKIKYGDGSTAWNSLGYFVALADGKVGIDSGATPDYLGAADNDGVLRIDATLDYADGGNFVTLSLDSTLKSNYDAAFSHVSANGSDHSYLNQSVTTGSSPTFAKVTVSSNDAVLLHLIETDTGVGVVRITNANDVDGWYLGITGDQNFAVSRALDIGAAGAAFTIKQSGDTGIGDVTPSFKLDVNGDGRFTGKLTSLGTVDPPGVLYDSETRASTVARVKREVPKDKLRGCFMFYNGETENMELYFPSSGAFKNFNGELIDSVEPITETYATVDKYHLEELTGEVIKTQVEAPENKKYKVKEGCSLDSKTGKFFDDKNEEITKGEAVEYVNKVEPLKGE